MAPSTLGTFLRSFSFGHVCQLDRVLAESIRRAWSAGAGPGCERLVIDIDSLIGEVHGSEKQGAGFGYTGERGYHPILATRSGSGEVLHGRLRKGQGGLGTRRASLPARAGCPGASRWRQRRDPDPRRLGVLEQEGARLPRQEGLPLLGRGDDARVVAERIALIFEQAWQPLADYPDTGLCELAETTLGDERLVVRRVHLHAQEDQTELFAYWRHFAFVTNRSEDLHTVDREHRQHAEVELAIRDLKDQALAHSPSGRFGANSAWTVIACLVHNLQRWTGMLGVEDATPHTARTIRRWLLAIPGRLTHTTRRWTLHLPARWPWQRSFIEALTRIRALPTVP